MLEVELHRKVSGTLKLQVSAVDWSFLVRPPSEEARMKISFQNRKANLELSTINRIGLNEISDGCSTGFLQHLFLLRFYFLRDGTFLLPMPFK